MLKRIGEYYLNMPAREMFELSEFTAQEYSVFESAGVKRIFRSEKIYHGRNILFEGAVWKTVIGASDGFIYRIAAQTLNADKDRSEAAFNSAYRLLSGEMGAHNAGIAGKNCIWDTEEGSAILDLSAGEDCYAVQICLTSSFIRPQAGDHSRELYKV